MKKRINILLTSIFTLLLLFTNIVRVNAASANIQVTSGTNKIVVGNTFTVNVKVSSSNVLGAWEWTISYDAKKLKLMSGPSTVKDYGDSKLKSKTYTYKFKAIATGSTSVTVKSAAVYDYGTEKTMSLSKGTKSVSIITQAQLESSYSKNNNLKSLSVDGLKLSPEFNKNTTEYKVEADSNTESVKVNATKEDSKASVSGTGTHDVTEGENKIKITVTAENGSTKTYTIIVNVSDPNPINVKINDKDYTVVKRESKLESPKNYEKTEITISEQKVPAFYNETNNFTLVGLKDKDGNIKLYIYNKDTNEYKEYSETTLSQNKIYPLPLDKEIDGYTKTTIKINEIEYEAYTDETNEFYIIHAKDLDTGKDNYFTYDKINNTIIRFHEKEEKPNETPNCDSKLKEYKKMLILLFGETIIIFLILICILILKINKTKKRKKQRKLMLLEEQRKQAEQQELEKKKELELKKQEEQKEIIKDEPISKEIKNDKQKLDKKKNKKK